MAQLRMLFGNAIGETVEAVVTAEKTTGFNSVESRVESGLASNGFVRLDTEETFRPTPYMTLMTYMVIFDLVAWYGVLWFFQWVAGDSHTGAARQQAINSTIDSLWIVMPVCLLLTMIVFLWPQHQARSLAAQRQKIRELVAKKSEQVK